MSSKYKATGCARFFIVLIILAPLAYLGASYYNGEDGIENVKNLLGIGASDSDSQPSIKTNPESNEVEEELPAENMSTDSGEQKDEQAQDGEKKINAQEDRIDQLTNENEKLKEDHDDILKRIKALEEENEALKTAQDTTG